MSRLIVVAVVAVILVLLWLGLEKTKFGLIVRAGAKDPQIMRVLGVDISKVWLLVFGLGIGLTALGGVLAALTPSLANALVGVVAGALVLLGVSMVGKMRRAA